VRTVASYAAADRSRRRRRLVLGISGRCRRQSRSCRRSPRCGIDTVVGEATGSTAAPLRRRPRSFHRILLRVVVVVVVEKRSYGRGAV